MWEVYLFQVTTGNIGPMVHPESGSWSISLNETETLRVRLRKSDLPKVDLNLWLDPWWAGVLFVYDGRPIAAGPIVSRPSEGPDYIDLECSGIRSIFAKRFVIHEQDDWTKLAKSRVRWTNLSLGTIAEKVVAQVQLKPGGYLPIAYPQRGDDTGKHERTYQGFDLQNINADDVLTKISNVSDGPDIMFRPRLAADNQLFFDLYRGLEDSPRIPQVRTPVFDTTAHMSSISEVRLVSTGVHQTNRVFGIGAGMDEGTIIRMAEDQGPTVKGYPLLETAFSTGDKENANLVSSHAKATLQQNKSKLLEISVNARADGPPLKLGQYFVGDMVQLVVKGWISLKDGTHRARILNINGDLSNDIRMSLQLDGN